jgi:hypothetical protein
LYEELIAKKREVLLMLSGSDPCLLIDCKQFPSDVVRQFAAYALEEQPSHETGLREDRNAYIAMGTFALMCMSFVITFLTYIRGRRTENAASKKKVKNKRK